MAQIGKYAEVTVRRDHAVWKLLLDEKNLAMLLLQSRTVLEAIRAS